MTKATMRVSILAVFTYTIVTVTAQLPPSGDICAFLEQEVAGKVTPFLGSKHGIYYVAGQSHSPEPPDSRTLWETRENETLGFTHAFLRDGRSRGEGIVTDRVTGTGHDTWGWEFWRNTRNGKQGRGARPGARTASVKA